MNKIKTQINKTLYAIVFLIVIPGMLWGWAKFTEDLINLPVIESTLAAKICNKWAVPFF